MNPAAPYQPKTLKNDFFTGMALLLFSGLFFSVLVIADDLHDSTRTGKIFFFARWMLAVISVGLIVFIRNRKQPVDLLSILVLLWGGWIILRGKTGGIWHDEKFFWFAGCWVFFFLAGAALTSILRNGQIKLLLIPALVITLVAGAEAVLGLLQLYGGYRIFHGTFKVTGTFINPALYAGFLLASFPWALLLCHRRLSLSFKEKHPQPTGGILPFRGIRGVSGRLLGLMKRTKKLFLAKQYLVRHIFYWFGFLTVMLIIIVIPSTRSRAAFLGLAVAVSVWAFYRYKPSLYLKYILNSKLKQRLAFTVVPVTIIILLTALYLFKKDSANGRLLIWKVAVQIIKEKPLTGHGFNTAQAILAPAQAAYFAAGNGSKSEKMLAGSVRWTFNEPLQTASETGLPGSLILMLVTGYALFYKVSQPVSRQQYLHIGAARASLAGIAVFGCFSYPFYSPASYAAFLLCAGGSGSL